MYRKPNPRFDVILAMESGRAIDFEKAVPGDSHRLVHFLRAETADLAERQRKAAEIREQLKREVRAGIGGDGSGTSNGTPLNHNQLGNNVPMR
jgi:protein-tyrosine-phosphatase